MSIRDVRAEDGEAVARLLVAAFGGPAESLLVQQLRAEGDAIIELVAEDRGEITGHILFSRMDARFRALALAPLAVMPRCQRQGIGSRLVEAGHERAAGGQWDAIFVLGDPAYYMRFGYDPALAEPFENRYSGAHFMMRPLRPAAAIEHGPVRHAPAFNALEEE